VESFCHEAIMTQRSAAETILFLRVRLTLFVLLIGLLCGTVGLKAGAWQAEGEPAWPLGVALAGLMGVALLWLHQAILRPWQQAAEEQQRDRTWRESDREHLAQLAAGQQTALAEHERTREHLDRTLAAARIATWDWDVQAARTTWSASASELLGLSASAGDQSLEDVLAAVVPEDQPILRTARRAALEDRAGDRYQATFRVRLANGEVRKLEERGRLFRDDQGKPVRLMGVWLDATAPRGSKETENPPASVSLPPSLPVSLSSESGPLLGAGETTVPSPNEEQKDAERPGSRPLRILVVEDNAVNCEVLQRQLERAGHGVGRAHNGREALETLDREKFDLVLMDGQMPEMDGLRATRLLRAREKAVGGRVPVVAITANVVPGERERCLAAGMDDYLTKPVSSSLLFATIARLTGSRAGETGEEEETGEDWLAKLRSMRFDRNAITRLVQTALAEMPERMAALRQAMTLGDVPQVKATAHSLKGTLGIFSPACALAAARIEGVASEEQLAERAAALGALLAEVTPLMASMRAFLEREN
jgi:CheY-like chemotaxis protein/PAS domain-containing protein